VVNAPKRGEIVWLTFDPQAGHEQAGRRPALVISDSRYNDRTGLAMVCPITSRIKGYRFELPVDVDGISGVVIADQARSLDWRARNARLIAVAPESVLLGVVQIVAGLIGAAA
jgi:mRNA interferase MazF